MELISKLNDPVLLYFRRLIVRSSATNRDLMSKCIRLLNSGALNRSSTLISVPNMVFKWRECGMRPVILGRVSEPYSCNFPEAL